MERPNKSGNQLFTQMKEGVKLKKVSCHRRRRSVNERTFKVTDNELYLHYGPSKKKVHNLRVEIDDIQEVRSGRNTDKFRDVKTFPEKCCFSIILTGESRIVNLVATSPEEAKLWIRGLKLLKKKSEKIDVRVKQAIWIKEVFTKTDENGDGRLDFKEIIKLVRKMNVKIGDDYAQALFKKADAQANGTLDEEEFVTFYREITKRPEVEKLFLRFAGEDRFLTAEEFQDFMIKGQKKKVDRDWCAEMIDKYEPKAELRQKKLMTLDGFMFFLLSDEGNLLDPKNRSIYQDMTRPLSHYYISSSHNTYLLEDQLKGPSSVEAYISALQKGCRCVELDVWDGPDEPVIYHGHTLTSKILLRDALASIREYAFLTSQYPLILSFENHCSIEQQKQMAEIIEETVGDFLYRLERPEGVTELPSPEELKHKILVKGKKLPAFSSTPQGGDVSDEDEAADIDGAEVDEETRIKIQEEKKKKSKTIKLAKEFSDTVYLSSRHFKSVSEEMTTRKPFEMSSFAEAKATDLAKKGGQAMTAYSSRFLSRIYPAGWRTNSSNYNPIPMWNVGAQIVALNFQSDGEMMDLNRGRFLENGNCGYVLKPEFMLSEDVKPKSKLESFQMRIVIITGQQFPKSSKDITDPYVKVTLYGTKKVTEHKTDVIKNNGFNPEWKCRMDFEVQDPELSLMRFEVMDKDVSSKDDLMAQYSLPVSCMQQGYQHITLRSPEGNELSSSTLFIHVTKKRESSSNGEQAATQEQEFISGW